MKQRSYPVEAHLGLYWAYLGPAPAPLLPTCGVALEWGVLGIEEQVEIHCNWLQVVENNMDGLHFPILHQTTGGGRWPGVEPANTTRGYIDQFVSQEYWEEPWGIMRKAVYREGSRGPHPLSVGETDAVIFPNIRRHHDDVSIKVPVDDVTTTKYVLFLTKHAEANRPTEHWVRETHQEVRNTPDGRHRMDSVSFQDLAVMESQGPISQRENWRVATSDRGLALFHEYLLRKMARAERGLDPQGVARNPEDASATPVLWEPAAGRFRGNGIKMFPGERRGPIPAGHA